MRSRLVLVLSLVGLVCVSGGLGSFAEPRQTSAAEPLLADAKVPSFKTDVMPILKDSCVGCHNAKKAKGRVDLSSYDAVMKSVKANDADKSRLVKSVLGQGAKQMPPKNPLPEAQVAVLKAWIAGGAKND